MGPPAPATAVGTQSCKWSQTSLNTHIPTTCNTRTEILLSTELGEVRDTGAEEVLAVSKSS